MIKKNYKKILVSLLAAFGVFLVPLIASAHEVYVLSHSEIAMDLLYPPINLFAVAVSHKYQFLTAALLGVIVVVCVFGISILHNLGRRIDPFLFKIKPYAGHIAQITIGFALIASAYYGALFGTELPLVMLFGTHAQAVTLVLYFAGGCILFGVYPRIGALLALWLFVWSVVGEGVYMLSYLTYFGESMIILLFGAGYTLFSYKLEPHGSLKKIYSAVKRRKEFIMRICFSTSLIYAALYAKLIHGELALNTVMKYHLTNYFSFDPLFIVLGAFLIEMSIGLFFLIGFEIRFTALFFLTFLTMSLVFFGESIWPHIVLIGTAITMLVHGYDEFTIEKLWYKKGKREPVL